MAEFTSHRILICGDRNWDDAPAIDRALFGYKSLIGDGVMGVISGMARGADSIAAQWARDWHIPLLAYPADWNKHGRSAGPIRNIEMLEHGKPDVVYAFHDNLAESKGTKHMVSIAKRAGIPTYIVRRA